MSAPAFCGWAGRSNAASVAAVESTASVFSRSKEMTCCGLLSSRTVKSSRLRSRTGLPFLSRTVTFTSTSSVLERNVYSVDDVLRNHAGAQHHDDEHRRKRWSERASSPVRAMNPRSRLFASAHQNLNLAVSCRERIASHGNHPAIGRRVHDGVDPDVLRRIENIRELRPEFQETRFTEGKNLGERHIEQPAARSFDTVAARIAEHARRARRTRPC